MPFDSHRAIMKSQVDKRRMCPNCRAFITTDDKTCPYCEMKVGPRAIDRRYPADVLGGLIPHARFTTMMILLVNVGFYLATVVYTWRTTGQTGFEPDGQALFAFGAKFGNAIQAGQWWRLITAGFLHGGVMHIAMNLWVLFDLGVAVEEAYGTSRYLVIYFVSTITGFWASYWWAPGVLSIGASAALFGLIGAMIALGIRDRSSRGVAIRNMYLRWAIYILIIGLLPIFSIDNAAHIGGGIGGFVVGYLAGTPRIARPVEGFWRGAAAIAGGITVLAFVQMFLWLASQQQ
ncbi:MAG TPA: rhomboid family intramembrane serine protease [Bryobacteraceae bacterium]|jgi:rhomboid protease GluP